MMKKTPSIPVIIFFMSAAVIAACSLLAKDWYKKDYLEWERLFTDVERSAFSATHKMLRVHSGFESDYKGLIESADSISAQLSFLTTKRKQIDADGAWQRFQLSIPEIETLNTLGNSFTASLINFEANSSQLKYATSIAFQTLQQMRATTGANDTEWRANISTIEKKLLQKYILNNIDNGEKLSHFINRLILNPGSRQEREQLTALEEQVKNIEVYSPILDTVLETHFKVEKLLGAEINRLRMRTAWYYEEATTKGDSAEISVAMMTLFILVYGTYFALQSIKFSSQLQDTNRTLERKVKAKTKELEQKIDLLRTETDTKNAVLASLKATETEIKQREAFFRAITEKASDPILIVDKKLFIRFSNAATHLLFECGETEFIEKGFAEYLPQIDSIEKLVGTKQSNTIGITSSGSKLSLNISLSKIEEDNDTRYVCILHNVSNLNLATQGAA
ncbi:MAG: PAS domain-containing protein [Pseudomonadales bacterium]